MKNKKVEVKEEELSKQEEKEEEENVRPLAALVGKFSKDPRLTMLAREFPGGNVNARELVKQILTLDGRFVWQLLSQKIFLMKS